MTRTADPGPLVAGSPTHVADSMTSVGPHRLRR
jgi:hypothetical protein